jgi:hypothetical protein
MGWCSLGVTCGPFFEKSVGLILRKFAENYFVYFVYSQVFRLFSRLFSKYFDFVYSQSISSIFKILRVFQNYFVYSQIISFILNLTAFYSHLNISPSEKSNLNMFFHMLCRTKTKNSCLY